MYTSQKQEIDAYMHMMLSVNMNRFIYVLWWRACMVYAHMWVLFNSFKQTTYETSNVFLTGIHSRGPNFGSVVLTVQIARRHTHMRLFNTNLEIFWDWMYEDFFTVENVYFLQIIFFKYILLGSYHSVHTVSPI